MTELHRSRGTIGRSAVRQGARRLATGRGTYTDDLSFPRMAHVALWRSPTAHARITGIETGDALASPGVIGVFTADDLEPVCKPMQTALDHVPAHKSPLQYPLARDEVAWHGEPVVAVVAATRAQAEDAVELIEVEFEDLPVAATLAQARSETSPAVHTALASNTAVEMTFRKGEAGGDAHATLAHRFRFGRLTGLPLETRVIVADYNPADETLTVYQPHQQPHLMQALYARQLGLPEHRVRVISKDVGGAFGVKMHGYPDDLAVAAIARLLERPVKYCPDRMEALMSDAHAREFEIEGRISVDSDGRILEFGADISCAIGAYSIFPRSSIGDAVQAATFLGTPYRARALNVDTRAIYQNKAPTGAVRGVSMPIGCAVTEQLVDLAAHELDLDPAEMRRRNYLRDEDYPLTTLGGLAVDSLSLNASLDRILELMDYDGLRREQRELRQKGVYRGIGLATFVEQTAVGAGLYGPGGVPVTAQDECALRFEPSGVVRCAVGCTDQGQGTMTGIAQIVADVLSVPLEDVTVTSGDSAGPQGGGAWSSRGLSIGGEAAYRAAADLKQRVLGVAAAIMQKQPDELDLRDGHIFDLTSGQASMPLSDVTRIAYFRQDTLPADVEPELAVTRKFIPRTSPYFMANGIQACHLELDSETGVIRLLRHWVVEDCGRIVNPQLVDEQIRGGVVQGLGAALFEHCRYDEDGQMLSATLIDYLVPMAAEMPDIEVAHLETPQPGTALGAKGAGEAGTVGAPAAVWCAVNDALRPLGARVSDQPFTPEVVLDAIDAARRS